MQKYILFGTGTYYKNNIDRVKSKVDIVALLDNSKKKEGVYIDGIKVYMPCSICEFMYDKILLLATDILAREMYNQLITLGVKNDKIQFLDEFIGAYYSDVCNVYHGKKEKFQEKKKIGIISTKLNYNGGTIAACNLARVLADEGISVSIIVPDVNEKLVDEITRYSIDVIVCPAINCLTYKTIESIIKFDIIIVNTFQMIDAVVKISSKKKILWWIHEPSDDYCSIYANVFSRYPGYRSLNFNNVKIYAVSSIAKGNFKKYFPNVECAILPCTLPDYKLDTETITLKEKKIIFALIANFSQLKAQKEFAIAASEVEKKYSDSAEFWLIGNVGETNYSKEIISITQKVPSIKILGSMTQDEIKQIYKKINVVVCPSYEETLSIVTVEGMMNSKVCIASNRTGIAQYITDKKSGLICNPGDVISLSSCMEWCIENRESLEEIGQDGRKVYDDNFTQEKMKDRLNSIIKEFMKS